VVDLNQEAIGKTKREVEALLDCLV